MEDQQPLEFRPPLFRSFATTGEAAAAAAAYLPPDAAAFLLDRSNWSRDAERKLADEGEMTVKGVALRLLDHKHRSRADSLLPDYYQGSWSVNPREWRLRRL